MFIDDGPHTVQHRYVFKSFDELPDYVADSIREDGRTEGEITTTHPLSRKKTSSETPKLSLAECPPRGADAS